jgi:hypothetical protein
MTTGEVDGVELEIETGAEGVAEILVAVWPTELDGEVCEVPPDGGTFVETEVSSAAD